MAEVATMEMTPVVVPIWTKYSSKTDALTVVKLFPGLGRQVLDGLVDAGHVRRKKTGPGLANCVLYRVSDINEWLEGPSTGSGQGGAE